VREWLDGARGYRAFGRLIGAERAYRIFAREYVRAAPGQRVLDIGCGTAELSDFLADADYLGLDPNESYLREARSRHPETELVHASFADFDAAPRSFHRVVASGVLHHLDDDQVDALVRLAARLLRPDGRFVTLDGARLPGQPRTVRWLLDHDRGRFVRSQAAYAAIAERWFTRVSSITRRDLLRIPYHHVILDCERPRVRDP